MYRIAVCDDEAQVRKHIINTLSDIMVFYAKRYEVDEYESGEALLHALYKGGMYDLLLLDIYMHEKSGMQVANTIRRNDGGVSIAFITSSPDFVYEGYDVGAVGYLLKPIMQEKLEQLIKKDWERKNLETFISLKKKNEIIRVFCRDIVYLESSGRQVGIITKAQRIDIYEKMDDILKKLPAPMFCRCHKSYAANINFIDKVSSSRIALKSGDTLPVSRSNYQNVKHSFLEFLRAGR